MVEFGNHSSEEYSRPTQYERAIVGNENEVNGRREIRDGKTDDVTPEKMENYKTYTRNSSECKRNGNQRGLERQGKRRIKIEREIETDREKEGK